jgi:UDP-glucose 4-epimerase
MSNMLVTGGAGFIGSHLCERLYQLGHTVTSLDNYFTGSISNHIPGVQYIRGSTEYINHIFRTRDFDIVYHLGEYSRVEQSFDDIDLVWHYNKLGTQQVLEYVKRTKAKLVYAGSSTKFANDDNDYVQSPYAWSKTSNTELVNLYAKWYDLDYAITYFYNVYGKREIAEGKYATLIAKYKTLAKKNMALPVVLPGMQRRNFTHIDDIIDALVLIGFHGHGDEYGIGSDETYTVLEVAKLFQQPIEYLEPRKGNRLASRIVTEKTKALGWDTKQSLSRYIEQLKHNGWNDE